VIAGRARSWLRAVTLSFQTLISRRRERLRAMSHANSSSPDSIAWTTRSSLQSRSSMQTSIGSNGRMTGNRTSGDGIITPPPRRSFRGDGAPALVVAIRWSRDPDPHRLSLLRFLKPSQRNPTPLGRGMIRVRESLEDRLFRDSKVGAAALVQKMDGLVSQPSRAALGRRSDSPPAPLHDWRRAWGLSLRWARRCSRLPDWRIRGAG